MCVFVRVCVCCDATNHFPLTIHMNSIIIIHRTDWQSSTLSIFIFFVCYFSILSLLLLVLLPLEMLFNLYCTNSFINMLFDQSEKDGK